MAYELCLLDMWTQVWRHNSGSWSFTILGLRVECIVDWRLDAPSIENKYCVVVIE